jgi:hypothetical protein
MHGFDKELVLATIQHIVHLSSTGGIEQVLQDSKPNRCTAEDLNAVLAEHGQCFTLPAKAPKIYLTRSKGEPAKLYADIRMDVDGTPSELVLRCTLLDEQKAGRYIYRVEDLLAP